MAEKVKTVHLKALVTISRPESDEPVEMNEAGYPVQDIFIRPGEEFDLPVENATILLELGFVEKASGARTPAPEIRAATGPETPAVKPAEG